MSAKPGPIVLHEAFEDGQARAWGQDEARAWVWTAAILGMMWGVPLGILAGGGFALWQDLGYPLCLATGAVGGYLTVSGAVLVWGMYPQFGRLWSEREARTYAPPQPQPTSLPHPPIAVYPPGKKEPYLLTEPEAPGREPLRLTPPTIAEILQLVLEKNRGTWSRRTLTRLRLATGEKLSRGVYEALTPWLHKSGVLEQTPQGGYKVLAEDLEELRDIFPGLPIAGRGTGEPGDRTGERVSDARPPGRAVGTLAERHRLARLDELEHSVRDYLERKGLDGV